MTFRAIAAFFVGCAVWWFLFLAVGIASGLLWPDYREAARVMFSEGDTSQFSDPMLLVNFVVFISAGLVVGWLVSLIGRSRTPTLVVALLYLILMATNHYIFAWDLFPAWYNLVVPLVVSGSIVLGGRLAGVASSVSESN